LFYNNINCIFVSNIDIMENINKIEIEAYTKKAIKSINKITVAIERLNDVIDKNKLIKVELSYSQKTSLSLYDKIKQYLKHTLWKK